MQYDEIKVLDVDEALVDSLWGKIKDTGSFYSIGDGATKDVFRAALYKSSYVLEISGAIIRLEVGDFLVELHPIVFGPSLYEVAPKMLKEIYERFGSSFRKKSICCIIPQGMRAAKRLAVRAGMREFGPVTRLLSGVPLPCVMYGWRP